MTSDRFVPQVEQRRFVAMTARILRVAHTRAPDLDVADRMRDLVRDDVAAATSTLDYVAWEVGRGAGYLADRAERTLAAAIQGGPPAAVGRRLATGFARERELGWMPLAVAFEALSGVVAGLSELAQELVASAGEEQRLLGRRARRGSFFPENVWIRVPRLAGPASRETDPLARSRLAEQVSTAFLEAVAGQAGALDPKFPFWEWHRRDGRVVEWPQAFRL
jgi:hypothetical protein